MTALGSGAGTPFATTASVPDLLHACGEMLRSPDERLTLIFATIVASGTALLVLFTVGSVFGQLFKASRRARRAHKQLRK